MAAIRTSQVVQLAYRRCIRLRNLRTDRVYDQQDAFYLPLAGLNGIRCRGPAFELFRKREE